MKFSFLQQQNKCAITQRVVCMKQARLHFTVIFNFRTAKAHNKDCDVWSSDL